MELLTIYPLSFFTWVTDRVTELSQCLDWSLGLIGFLLAIMIYYSQSVQNKRVCWYCTSKGNHYWIAFFNGSKKILLNDDVSLEKPFRIYLKGMKSCQLVEPGTPPKVIQSFPVEPKNGPSEDSFAKVTFGDYLEPGAFKIFEMEAEPGKNKPLLKGYLKDGVVRTKGWALMVASHSWWFPILLLTAIAGFAYVYIYHHAVDSITDDSSIYFWYAIALAVIYSLCIGRAIYLFRRVPYPSFRKARKTILDRKDKVPGACQPKSKIDDAVNPLIGTDQ